MLGSVARCVCMYVCMCESDYRSGLFSWHKWACTCVLCGSREGQLRFHEGRCSVVTSKHGEHIRQQLRAVVIVYLCTTGSGGRGSSGGGSACGRSSRSRSRSIVECVERCINLSSVGIDSSGPDSSAVVVVGGGSGCGGSDDSGCDRDGRDGRDG